MGGLCRVNVDRIRGRRPQIAHFYPRLASPSRRITALERRFSPTCQGFAAGRAGARFTDKVSPPTEHRLNAAGFTH